MNSWELAGVGNRNGGLNKLSSYSPVVDRQYQEIQNCNTAVKSQQGPTVITELHEPFNSRYGGSQSSPPPGLESPLSVHLVTLLWLQFLQGRESVILHYANAVAPRIMSSSPKRENTRERIRIPEDRPKTPEKRMSRTLNLSRAPSRRNTSSTKPDIKYTSPSKPNMPIAPAVAPTNNPVASQLNTPQWIDQNRALLFGIKPPKFKPGSSFKSYLGRFEDWLKTATLHPQQVPGTLINCLKCDATYTRVRRLKFSQEEMADPNKLLKFIRETIVNDAAVAETRRLELKEIKQEEYESVSDFAERIHQIAELAFPDETDDRINANKIDALQDGLHDRDVAKDVCDWKKQDVAFETLVAEAERAATQNKIFKRGGAESRAAVYAIRNEGPGMINNPPYQRKTWNPCKFCKKTNHSESHCRFKIICQLCGQELHDAKNCPTLSSNIQANMNPVQNLQTPNFQPQTFTTGIGGFYPPSSRRQATPLIPGTRDHDRANGLCYICHENGHLSRACNNRGRQLNERAVGDLNNMNTHLNSGRVN
eukprot:sb/3463723/